MNIARRFSLYKNAVIFQGLVLNVVFHFVIFQSVLQIPPVYLLINIVPIVFFLIGLALIGNRLDLRREFNLDNYASIMWADHILFLLTFAVLIPDAVQSLFPFLVSFSINTAIIGFCSLKILQIKYKKEE